MSTFKQIVNDYEKEYDGYVKIGLTEEEALELVTKHIRQGKKPLTISTPQTEKITVSTPQLEKEKKCCEKEIGCKSIDEFLKDCFNFDKFQDSFFNYEDKFKKLFTNLNEKPAPKNDNKQLINKESDKFNALVKECVKNGDKLNVIANKPNHLEYELNKSDGSYYKYCFKQF